MLVDSVEQYGLGNWDEVAFNIPGKTAKEVEDHYMVVYVEGDLGRLTVPSDLPNKITDHSPFIHGKFGRVFMCDVSWCYDC